jgi:hypothetical protein
MDDRLKQALDFSAYRQSVLIHTKQLKEKIDAKLTFGYNSGLFKIDRSLITFVQMLIDQERTENIPLLDFNNTPIMIENLEHFRDEVLDRYFTSLYEYHEEYERLKKSRSVEQLANYG